MVKINFERLEIFTNLEKTQCVVQDMKKDFSSIIYQLGIGIEAHALALKIFNSHGEIEYDERECEIIGEMSKMCTPSFMDAISKILGK